MKRTMSAVSAVSVLALLLAGCSGAGGDGGGSGDGDTITIGASIPLTGSLAGFGPLIQDGYQDAVDQVNAAGGIEIDGTAHQVELVVQDNKSDSTTAGDQARSLILENGAVALLGSVSPPLNIPMSNVAEVEQVPFVTSLTPTRAWRAGNESGWTYAWDMFFDEETMTDLQFTTSDLVATNKKVALFTDNEEDGITMGALWEAKAPTFGYEIVSHSEFPVGTSDFSSFINDAKAAGAEVVIAQMTPPDAFALWKQMKALQFDPQVAFCEKCAATAAFQKELGETAEGTTSTNFYETSEHPDAVRLTEKFGAQLGQNVDLSTLIISQSAAQVLLDAIAAAGSTDGSAINEAIGATDKEYAVGDISFSDENVADITPVSSQWQGDQMVQVNPQGANSGTLEAPVAGLK
ncbi:ABC transporter substrate-binding protein [Herbiconiux sp. KACC 21604]|uniref:ABC transporter substrate-binding protein n=1 Tax=unclassified Herbiconiux TaxID=2618217 RepID=UPI00149212E2|nr:ABC transporter substrate-binding protein [Herbiconiux sp. SALV-R1]QJU55638.1 ABC transporter substrate-binding protein [Herbiconiux sp. SALV-R1]WPO86836.1 ABC transporter substrate-binding protein [Herbiconiux sp. KACC 21604]